ncbi:MAG: hypothetical protein WD049_04370 [Candidatus Paceibacterota bacterium]
MVELNHPCSRGEGSDQRLSSHPALTLILGDTKRLGGTIDAVDAYDIPTLYGGQSEPRPQHRDVMSVLSDG